MTRHKAFWDSIKNLKPEPNGLNVQPQLLFPLWEGLNMPTTGFEYAPWHSDFIAWIYRGLGGPNVGRLSEDKIRKEVMPVISKALVSVLTSETVEKDAEAFGGFFYGGFFDGMAKLTDGSLEFIPWDKIIDLVEAQSDDVDEEEGPSEDMVYAYIDDATKDKPESYYGGFILVSQDEALDES